MWDAFWGAMAVLASIGGIGVLIYLQAKGAPEHEAEDRAREFFDRHGHWPDEPPPL
jgi:hypothetical protein